MCIFSEFFTHFLIYLAVHSWLVSGQQLNFFFIELKKFLVYVSFLFTKESAIEMLENGNHFVLALVC